MDIDCSTRKVFRWGVVYKICGGKTWADLVSRWLLFKNKTKQKTSYDKPRPAY